jgi:hypothetical protein
MQGEPNAAFRGRSEEKKPSRHDQVQRWHARSTAPCYASLEQTKQHACRCGTDVQAVVQRLSPVVGSRPLQALKQVNARHPTPNRNTASGCSVLLRDAEEAIGFDHCTSAVLRREVGRPLGRIDRRRRDYNHARTSIRKVPHDRFEVDGVLVKRYVLSLVHLQHSSIVGTAWWVVHRVVQQCSGGLAQSEKGESAASLALHGGWCTVWCSSAVVVWRRVRRARV